MTETKQEVFTALLVDWARNEKQKLCATRTIGRSFLLKRIKSWQKHYDNATPETAEQQACPYCHMDKDGVIIFLLHGETGAIAAIDLMDKNIVVNIRGVQKYISINYCPKCGRRLGDEFEA